MKSIFTRQQKRYFLMVCIAALAVFIVMGLYSYVSAFIGSVILYVLFKPLFDYLVKRRGWNRTLSTVLIIVGSFLVIVLPFLLLSWMLADKVVYYSQRSGALVSELDKLGARWGVNIHNEDTLRTVAERGGAFAANLFPSLLTGALDIILVIGLMYFVLYYMYTQEETAMNEAIAVYVPFDPAVRRDMHTELRNSINANVIGQGLISLVQAGLLSLGFYIFGLPDAAFWGFVCFFASFVPVLGTPIIWIPAGLFALAQGDTTAGVGILLWGGLLVTNIDNVLRLFIAKRMGDIHPLITIVGIVLGVPLFGITGLVIGPVLLSYFLLLMRVYRRQREVERIETKAKMSAARAIGSTSQEVL